MTLESLYTIHLPKGQKQEVLPASDGAFALETCLRHIGICRRLPSQFTPGTQIFQGRDAYRFLLEVACGLHSKMQGESEIFGQIKQGWKDFVTEFSEEAKPLSRVMQHLFADTKRIRTDYLHGFGQSYAGATQKLLGLKKTDRLLIIGAGQFGQMFAEKLHDKVEQLIVMNRGSASLKTLKTKFADIDIVAGYDTLETAMKNATHVLVCVPLGADASLDARIQAAWKKSKKGTLIHFGQMDFLGTEWALLPRFYGLADVMARQNTNSETRPQKIAAAFAAAQALAEERASGFNLQSRITQVA